MAIEPNLGRMQTSMGEGRAKLLHTWTYRSGLPGQRDVEVKVHLLFEDGRFSFSASSPDFEVDFQDEDLNALKSKVEAVVAKACQNAAGIVWEDWLEVVVEGRAVQSERRGTGMGLTVTYRVIPRGVLPDGTVKTVGRSGRTLVDFPSPRRSSANLDAQTLVMDETHPGCEVSYIKATPEAYAALDLLQKRLNHLRNALSELLSQDQVDRLPKLVQCPLMISPVD